RPALARGAAAGPAGHRRSDPAVEYARRSQCAPESAPERYDDHDRHRSARRRPRSARHRPRHGPGPPVTPPAAGSIGSNTARTNGPARTPLAAVQDLASGPPAPLPERAPRDLTGSPPHGPHHGPGPWEPFALERLTPGLRPGDGRPRRGP